MPRLAMWYSMQKETRRKWMREGWESQARPKRGYEKGEPDSKYSMCCDMVGLFLSV
jgi:hypothetical protein